jgi:hypothetical protein
VLFRTHFEPAAFVETLLGADGGKEEKEGFHTKHEGDFVAYRVKSLKENS